MKFNLRKVATGIALAGLSLTAHAVLHDRGPGMVYDDAQNITWLKDWNLSRTTGGHATGLMTWDQAAAWADGLTVGGYTDWRLPRLTALGDPECTLAQYVCDGSLPEHRDRVDYSELSNVWYVTLGAKPMTSPLTGEFNPDWGLPAGHLPFDNVAVPFGAYWLANRVLGQNLWSFSFSLNGVDSFRANWNADGFAVAVRDGDVMAAVPEPGSGLLLGMGLLVLILTVRGTNTGVAASNRTP